jgi:hypothetical protein
MPHTIATAITLTLFSLTHSLQAIAQAEFNVPLLYGPASGQTDPCVFASTPNNVNNNNSMTTMDALIACFTSFPYDPVAAAQIVNNAHSLLNRFAFTDMVTYTGPPWNKALVSTLPHIGILQGNEYNNVCMLSCRTYMKLWMQQ